MDDSERALEICAELEISAQFTLMIFNPDTTLDTLRSDLAFMRRYRSNPLNFCRAEIYAGTPLERRMIELGRARGNYQARVYSLIDPVADLACNIALNVFYSRCWANGSLMQTSIGLDHVASVVKRFSNDPRRRALCRQVAGWLRAVNLDMCELLEQVTDLAESAQGRADAVIEEAILEIREHETRTRQKFMSDGLNLKVAFQRFQFINGGFQDEKLSTPGRRLAGPVAAAALLAIGMSALPASREVTAQDVNAPPAISSARQHQLCSLEGRVTRQFEKPIKGGPIFYAMVTIENLDTGQTYMFRTDQDGRYVANDLHSGPITIKVQAAAFVPAEKNGIVLTPGVTRYADFELEIDCNYVGCTEYAASPLREPENLLTKRKPFTYSVGEREDANTFQGIAQVVYGDPNLWVQIYEANRKAIKKPGFLLSGTSILIPKKNRKIPKQTSRIMPVYPPAALQEHIWGDVILEISLKDDGSVERTDVLDGPKLLLNAAQDAVKQWRYQPSPKKNKGSKFVVVISFGKNGSIQ
jgi:TonB family protein